MTETVFFDLDGTLTDPKPGIVRSIQHAMRSLEFDVPTEDSLTWCIGPPLLDSLSTLVGKDNAPQALALYRQRFATTGLYENSRYPGIVNMLRDLANAELKLYVASSKPRVYVEKILAHFELRSYFEDVFGAGLDGLRADKTELLAYAVAETAAIPENSIMVGDRKYDAVGALNNRMGFIGVLYGYGSTAELKSAGARIFASTPSELTHKLR